MKRKLCCAVALVGDPHVVLLDEPSAGLDPVSQRNLWNLIKSTMTGRAVLLTTHSMLEADALCDRIGIQVRGQFHCVGSPQHLKDRYASGYELVAYLETADHEPALGAYLQSKLEAAGCGCALAGLAAGVATYELQGERPLKHAFACLEDADARARLGVRSFRAVWKSKLRRLDRVGVSIASSPRQPDSLVDCHVRFRVDRASMEKVFIRIVGEGGDEDLDTDATNAMGRSVAQALQDDQEEDLELARDLAVVGFDEPRDCCGILTRFGHASLARYSCAMCCGTYVYWCMGLFIQGIIPWLFCCWFCELWCVLVHKLTHGRIIVRRSIRSSRRVDPRAGASAAYGTGSAVALRKIPTERRRRGRRSARSSAASSRRS